MDKYTVDLDKLLNDFEYNELTDTQDTTSTTVTAPRSTDINVQLNNELPATTSNPKTTNAKHSITNVFHSLNEYISTDISSIPKKIDNICVNNTSNKVYKSSNVAPSNLDKALHTSVVDKVNPIILGKIDAKEEHSDLQDDSSLIKSIQFKAEELKPEYITEKTTNLLNENPYKPTTEEILPFKDDTDIRLHDELTEKILNESVTDEKNTLQEENSNSETSAQCTDSIETNPEKNKKDEEATIKTEVVRDDIVLTELISENDEPYKETLTSHNENVETLKLLDANSDVVNDDLEKPLEVVNEKSDELHTGNLEYDIKSDDVIKEEQFLKGDESNIENVNDIAIKTDTKIDNNNDNLIKEKLLSFETIEFDFGDVDEFLDRYEEEYDRERLKEEIKIERKPIECKVGKTMDKDEEEVSDEETDIIEPDEEIRVEQREKVEEENTVVSNRNNDNNKGLRIDGKGDEEIIRDEEVPQEKNQQPDANKNVTEISQVEVADGDGNVIDNKSETSSIESDIVNEEITMMESDERTTENDTIDAVKQDKDEEIHRGDGEIDVTDVVPVSNNGDRPTSLELETNDSKREIDLIGSPGSTPYNNVYLSKEESSGSDITSTTLTDSDDSACLESDDSENIVKNNEKIRMKNESKDIAKNNQSDDGSTGDTSEPGVWLGKQPPFWMPDSQAPTCQQCEINFTFIKRRHHCRACGLVLCSKCCNMKHHLQYLDIEARVCQKCFNVLSEQSNDNEENAVGASGTTTSSNNVVQPKPNNPMEYCSVVPPHQQVSNSSSNPPSVMVPVGVLKRKGSAKSKSNKSVMFCDGIRPGSDLTNLDADFNYNQQQVVASNLQQQEQNQQQQQQHQKLQRKHNNSKSFPVIEHDTKSFIPSLENGLPPTVNIYKSEVTYSECGNNASIVEMLKNETLTFAINRNLLVHVKIINMNCCINKVSWCFTTEGLIAVGQDEIVYLIEYLDEEKLVPKDIFYHINSIYCDAVKGTTVTELGLSLHNKSIFLNTKNHSGFLYIRPTLQCLQNVILPTEPYLIGLLIHRWESPWAKIFPLRLILRLGAEYRYYPSPIISTRDRDSVFVEIGHTIINLLADFKNFSYTIPNIRGLTIHMEDKNTTVTIPSNRYDQVMKTLNNSSDHILAFGGNFSMDADSHLVCIQDTQSSTENNYTTHAININNKPRKITGASFIVFNGALKSSSGLTAKSSIVEDGLMIQIPPENMVQVRDSLKNMKNHTIQCGCINAVSDELVKIVWGESDVNFNIGVTSPIDKQALNGVPSIRVHNGKDYACHSGSRIIRWTEVFILQNGDELAKAQQDPVDISKVAENISKATCSALVKYLDLLASNNFYKIGIRTTLQMDNVSYSAGSNGIKLPPIYMKSLDNELIPVLHRITSNNITDNPIILELIFRILNL